MTYCPTCHYVYQNYEAGEPCPGCWEIHGGVLADDDEHTCDICERPVAAPALIEGVCRPCWLASVGEIHTLADLPWAARALVALPTGDRAEPPADGGDRDQGRRLGDAAASGPAGGPAMMAPTRVLVACPWCDDDSDMDITLGAFEDDTTPRPVAIIDDLDGHCPHALAWNGRQMTAEDQDRLTEYAVSVWTERHEP